MRNELSAKRSVPHSCFFFSIPHSVGCTIQLLECYSFPRVEHTLHICVWDCSNARAHVGTWAENLCERFDSVEKSWNNRMLMFFYYSNKRNDDADVETAMVHSCIAESQLQTTTHTHNHVQSYTLSACVSVRVCFLFWLPLWQWLHLAVPLLLIAMIF